MKTTSTPGPHLCTIAFLITGLAIAAWRSPEPGQSAERRFSKTAMLEDLARQVIVPAYSNFALRCRDLSSGAEMFSRQPDAASLKQVQEAWIAAMLAWRPAQVFRSGPLLDQDILSRIHFWPIRRQSVEKVLKDTRPINDAYIAELGAPAVGLCAMEFMLFDLKRGNDAVLTAVQGEPGERRRVYLRSLSIDLARQAQRVVSAWTNSGGYEAQFVKGGQDSVNLIVNDLLQATEIATEERLKYALDLHENKLLKPEFIQGAAAGISQRSVSEVLQGAHHLYTGMGGFGLVTQLNQMSSPLATRAENQFQTALAALQQLQAPLEKALLADRGAVSRAYDECKKLEVMLKVDLASALGVTLTFNSTDGD